MGLSTKQWPELKSIVFHHRGHRGRRGKQGWALLTLLSSVSSVPSVVKGPFRYSPQSACAPLGSGAAILAGISVRTIR